MAERNLVDRAFVTSKAAAIGTVIGVAAPFVLQEKVLILALPAVGAVIGAIAGWLLSVLDDAPLQQTDQVGS